MQPFFHDILHHRAQEGAIILIPGRAVSPNLPLGSGEDAELTHLQHSLHELVKEEALIRREALHNALGPLVRVQILVRVKHPLPVHQIHVVLVVEPVGAADVQHGGVVGGGGGAGALEVAGEGLVHDGVLGGVEAAGEGGAVGEANGVAAGEGDDVGGGEVLGGERGENGGGVAAR